MSTTIMRDEDATRSSQTFEWNRSVQPSDMTQTFSTNSIGASSYENNYKVSLDVVFNNLVPGNAYSITSANIFEVDNNTEIDVNQTNINNIRKILLWPVSNLESSSFTRNEYDSNIDISIDEPNITSSIIPIIVENQNSSSSITANLMFYVEPNIISDIDPLKFTKNNVVLGSTTIQLTHELIESNVLYDVYSSFVIYNNNLYVTSHEFVGTAQTPSVGQPSVSFRNHSVAFDTITFDATIVADYHDKQSIVDSSISYEAKEEFSLANIYTRKVFG